MNEKISLDVFFQSKTHLLPSFLPEGAGNQLPGRIFIAGPGSRRLIYGNPKFSGLTGWTGVFTAPEAGSEALVQPDDLTSFEKNFLLKKPSAGLGATGTVRLAGCQGGLRLLRRPKVLPQRGLRRSTA